MLEKKIAGFKKKRKSFKKYKKNKNLKSVGFKKKSVRLSF